jgi:hypothetical protein
MSALDASEATDRLSALDEIRRGGPAPISSDVEYVNNHIHTIYSFSPYSPAKAAYAAWMNGLSTAGIMDHDSMAGAGEFIEACRLLGIAGTVGLECRVSMAGSPFEGKRLNNPDQKSVAYLALHGVPHQNIDAVQDFFAPYRRKRGERNRAMTERLNSILAERGIRLDYDLDVVSISQEARGGSVTERHILFALAEKLLAEIGRGQKLQDFFEGCLNLRVAGDGRAKLLAADDPDYKYRLLGALKGEFAESFYIDASDELPRVSDFVRMADDVGAIPAYPYLGDVKNSVTGAKKDQNFEDSYLDELMEWLPANGFKALTFMPARNSAPQLDRIMRLCDAHGLFQISGEDINSPFQPFRCEALADPRFAHLVTNTWALIGHELAASRDASDGMFSLKALAETPDLGERTALYAAVGRAG